MNNNKYTIRLNIIYGFLLFIIDLFFLIVSFILTYYLRFYTDIFGITAMSYSISNRYILYSLIIIAATVILLVFFNLYNLRKIYKNLYYYPQIIIILIISTILIYLSARLFDNLYLSRIWIVLFLLFSIILISVSRFIFAWVTRIVFKKTGIPHKGMMISFLDYLRVFKENTRIKKKVAYGVILVINDIVFFWSCILFFFLFEIQYWSSCRISISLFN